MNRFCAATLTTLLTSSAHAYLGPGMGGGIITAIIGIVAAIFIALFGVLYYPIKRMIKNKKK